MEKTKFKTLKLLGLKNVKEFLENKENETIIKKETIESVYENLKAKVDELWNLTYSIELLRQSIGEKDDIYTWIQYAKENDVVEVIPDFEKIYLESSELNESLENLLINLGSSEIKEKIYSNFKALYNEKERSKNEYSYINVACYGDKFREERKIISKVEILGLIKNEEDLELIEKLLEDYNPEIRSKAMKSLESVEEEKIKERKDLVEKIIKRLYDKPDYIRKAAFMLCKNKNIKISQEQERYIENEWERLDKGNSSKQENFLAELRE